MSGAAPERGRVVTVIDLETTGLAPPAAVIEAGCVHGYELRRDGGPLWRYRAGASRLGGETQSLFHPGAQEITPENRAIHHINPAQLADYPVFDWAELDDLLPAHPSFMVAHNAAFERQWLDPLLDELDEQFDWPVPRWICTKKCAITTWPDLPSHSNQVLRYALPVRGCTDDALSPPHRALPDARVTARILDRLLEHHTLDQLADITAAPLAYPRLPFGKHKGQPLPEVPASHLRWMLDNERDPDLIHTARVELHRRAAGG